MIIWGSKASDRKVGSGTFFCPNCCDHVPYTKQRISRYFTLYFIPLFPTETLGEYVRCGRCRSEMRSDVIHLTQEQVRFLTEPWNCGKCGNRNSASEGTCLSCQESRQPVALPANAPKAENSAPAPLPASPSQPPTDRKFDY